MSRRHGSSAHGGPREDPLETQQVVPPRGGARGACLAVAVGWLALAGCAAIPPGLPPTGPAVTPAEEERVLALFQDRAARFRETADRRLGAVSARLLPAMRVAMPVAFRLLDSGEVNAYARGGTVYVTLGMIRFARSDDELALVLGHELGHLVAERQAGAASPEDRERVADYHGLIGLHRAGYDIVAASEVWQRMATELAVPPGSRQAEGSARWAPSHPSFAERYAQARTLAEFLLRGAAAPPPAAQREPSSSPPSPAATHSLR